MGNSRIWKQCCEVQPTIDPETGRCQNGCGPIAAHTPTPWSESELTANTIQGDNGRYVARLGFGREPQEKLEDLANATFIVRAVNAHDALLDCVKEMLFMFKSDGDTDSSWIKLCEQAIAKAEGK